MVFDPAQAERACDAILAIDRREVRATTPALAAG
jgi:hypothetical protein